MKINEFIEKAIEGGWELDPAIGKDHTTWGCVEKHVWVRYLQRRYDKGRHQEGWFPEFNYYPYAPVWLDPKFWQAVERDRILNTKDWEKFTPKQIEEKAFRDAAVNMHHLMDAVIEGKTPEQFIETL